MGIDTKKLQRQTAEARARFMDLSMRTARDLGHASHRFIRDHTPQDTGQLQNAWELEIEGYRGGIAGARFDIEVEGDEHTQNVMQWQDQGTGIYGPKKKRIRPKHAKFLHWHDNPRVRGVHDPHTTDKLKESARFAKSVKGVRPNHMVKQTYEMLDKKTVQAIQEMQRIFGDVFR